MGNLYKRKHSKYYWFITTNPITGETIRQSTKKKIKVDAKKVLRLFERDLIEKGEKKEYYRYSFKEVLQKYYDNCENRVKEGSLYNTDKNIRLLLSFFDGGMRAIDINKQMISDYISYRRNKKITDGSILNELTCLRSSYRLCVEMDYLPLNILKEIVFKGLKSGTRKDFLEVWEYKQIRENLPDFMKDVLDVGYFTGMRIGEIVNLKWKNVDVVRGVFNLMDTKNNQRRSIFLVSRLKKRIDELYKEKMDTINDNRNPSEDLVFVKPDGSFINYIYSHWRKACKLCNYVDDDGKPTKTFHSTRRSFVRTMIRSGVRSEKIIMKQTGHKSRSVFDRYNIVIEEDVIEGIEGMEKWIENEMKDKNGKI